MNHKRHRPKSRRAGCMLCKPHKHQGAKLDDRNPPREQRKLQETEYSYRPSARESAQAAATCGDD